MPTTPPAAVTDATLREQLAQLQHAIGKDVEDIVATTVQRFQTDVLTRQDESLQRLAWQIGELSQVVSASKAPMTLSKACKKVRNSREVQTIAEAFQAQKIGKASSMSISEDTLNGKTVSHVGSNGPNTPKELQSLAEAKVQLLTSQASIHAGPAAATGAAQDVRLFGNIRNQLKGPADIDEAEYDVSGFYSREGLPQLIARNRWFGRLTLFFICSNAVYLGIDADRNDAPSISQASMGFRASEQVFCTFFFFELLIRFLSF